MEHGKRFNAFQLVYWVIAAATAQHTAWGAATTMQGMQPEVATMWWLQGIAFAIAIDASMILVATKIRTGTSASQYLKLWRVRIPINWYTVTFATVAIVSFYFQLLYAWAHAQPLPNVGGIAQEWIDRLQGVINARIVIAPLALPMIATLYTLGGFGKGGEAQSKQRNVATVAQPRRNPDATYIAVKVDELQQPAPQRQLPDGSKLRDSDGKLIGYVCPGCGNQLSISGWSRHKKSCQQYQLLMRPINDHIDIERR